MYDLLIFSGQSNMQGQTECLPESPNSDGLWEYRLKTESFIPLKHPCGEDIDDFLLSAHQGYGSLLPDFCFAYRQLTGRDVLAVHTARGSTVIADWSDTTKRYAALIEKINKAKQNAFKNHSVKNIFFIWLQGESDALIGTPQTEYEKSLLNLNKSLVRDTRIHKFMVICPGHFSGKSSDFDIINAQKNVCRENSDFLLLTDKAQEILSCPENMNPNAAGHFSNKGMARLAALSSQTAAKYANSIGK